MIYLTSVTRALQTKHLLQLVERDTPFKREINGLVPHGFLTGYIFRFGCVDT